MLTFVHLYSANFELFHNSFLIIALCKTLPGTNRIISQISLLYINVIKSEASLTKSDTKL